MEPRVMRRPVGPGPRPGSRVAGFVSVTYFDVRAGMR